MVIVLVRHAERESTGADSLTPAGFRRAAVLASMLKDAGITAIFTSSARRTKETAALLAEAIRIDPVEIAENAAAAASQVRASGDRVLVVGHSDSVPKLIAALGGPSEPDIPVSDFDRLFVLTSTGGEAVLLRMRYAST